MPNASELVALGNQARGRQPSGHYHEGDWIRVREFAPARTSAGRWVGVEKDSVLVVRSARADEPGGDWVQASDLGQPERGSADDARVVCGAV